jgi:hypothetical protein
MDGGDYTLWLINVAVDVAFEMEMRCDFLFL